MSFVFLFGSESYKTKPTRTQIHLCISGESLFIYAFKTSFRGIQDSVWNNAVQRTHSI